MPSTWPTAGRVRWLRPGFQAPRRAAETRRAKEIQVDLGLAAGAARKRRLPETLPDQVAAVRAALAASDGPVTAAALSARFAQGRRAAGRIDGVLRTLALLGQAERHGDGYLLARR